VGEALKMLDLTLQDMTMTDQIAGVENARPDNDGPIIKTEVWKTDGGKGREVKRARKQKRASSVLTL